MTDEGAEGATGGPEEPARPPVGQRAPDPLPPESAEAEEEPPPPEIDPAMLRALEEDLAAPLATPAAPEGAGEVEDDADTGTDDSSAAAPAESTAAPPAPEDPELPGVPLLARIEALLFAASEPLPLRRLKELTLVDDGRVVRDALDALSAGYAEAGSAIALEEVAGGFQLRTRPEFAPLVARLGRRTETERLSPAALETLAIVAYRQPVLRADIEKIRGVASGEVLRTLVERGLVRIAGRAELPGSPLLYGTTTRFLEVFGLRDLRDLPESLSERPAPSNARQEP